MDIGFQEIFLISVIALLVLGPERLPETARTLALWLNRLKRSFNQIKASIEREIDAEDIRQQIYNDNVLHALEQQEKESGDFEHEHDDTHEYHYDQSGNDSMTDNSHNTETDITQR